jgi:hypothetical protein
MTRLEANREIIKIISNIIEKNPDLRFEQAMYSIGLEWMNFDEESVETLDIINEKLHRINEDS